MSYDLFIPYPMYHQPYMVQKTTPLFLTRPKPFWIFFLLFTKGKQSSVSLERKTPKDFTPESSKSEELSERSEPQLMVEHAKNPITTFFKKC